MKGSQWVAEGFSRKILVDTIGAGIVLWAIGYTIGMILFALVPATMIGWIILPIMAPITIGTSLARFKIGTKSAPYVLLVSITWVSIAAAFDYVFLVNAFHVQNYYDLDVLVYYALTFLIPATIGIRYRRRNISHQRNHT
jgi:hypothetical protein